MDEHMYRKNIEVGMKVEIVLKKDQKTGVLTTGTVKKILTKKIYIQGELRSCFQMEKLGE